MLSYRHSKHAGNFADVLKHIVLVQLLESYRENEQPFDFIDTHAGAGLYNLRSLQEHGEREHKDGIARLNPKQWPELSSYFSIIQHYNRNESLDFYPGSPLITSYLLRPSDRAWFFEIHHEECERLKLNTVNDKHVEVSCEDGFKALLSLLPTVSPRCIALIDPPYEMTTDYEQVVAVMQETSYQAPDVTFVIWYPVVDRSRITTMELGLTASGIKKIQRFELGVSSNHGAKKMTAAGILVINSPSELKKNMAVILPRLVKVLGQDDSAYYKCETLAVE